MKAVLLHLEESTVTQLALLARSLGVPRAHVVRSLIQEGLKEPSRALPLSPGLPPPLDQPRTAPRSRSARPPGAVQVATWVSPQTQARLRSLNVSQAHMTRCALEWVLESPGRIMSALERGEAQQQGGERAQEEPEG